MGGEGLGVSCKGKIYEVLSIKSKHTLNRFQLRVCVIAGRLAKNYLSS